MINAIKFFSNLLPRCTAIIIASCLLLAAPVGSADTVSPSPCMDDLYTDGSLGCTANDVRIATATNITILDDGCAFEGDTVDFIATFEVVLGAQERHDIGIYFATDGDPNGDGALTGICSVSTPEYTPDPWVDLDGTSDNLPGVKGNNPSGIQDLCGDIDDDHNPLFPTITFTGVLCVPGENGKLLLPYATSWLQSGANQLCLTATEAIPGSPSKCKVDPGFTIDIDIPPATLGVVKTVVPLTLNEPGGVATFSVDITNNGIDPSNNVTLNSIMDNIYNDVTTAGHDSITSTTCSVPQTICPAGSSTCPGVSVTYSCSFTVNATGDGGDVEVDTVLAAGIDDRGNNIQGSDNATLTFVDVTPTITVVKSADKTEVLEPGENVAFSVLVTNNGVSSDPVTINSLVDNVHLDLNGQGTCAVPQILSGGGGTYSCIFTAFVGGSPGYSETDTVTASGMDDEGNSVTGNDIHTVVVNDVPSSIDVTKSVLPTTIAEPGGDVTYTFGVTSLATVDTITISSIMDNVLGNLNSQGDCVAPQILAPGGGYSCQVTAAVSGNAGETVPNTFTASGTDDDGNPLSDVASAMVTFTNVPPAASLTKTVTGAAVDYEVEVCNLSAAEQATVDSLVDDIYGDITSVVSDITASDCSTGQTLEPAGDVSEMDCYSCTFTATTTTSPTTDTVTGTVSDDEGGTVTPSNSATISWE